LEDIDGGPVPNWITSAYNRIWDGAAWTSWWNYLTSSDIRISRSRNTNSCFSIWWKKFFLVLLQLLHEEYNGNKLDSRTGNLNTARYALGGAGTSNSRFSIWW
jgi:hypothetical protein